MRSLTIKLFAVMAVVTLSLTGPVYADDAAAIADLRSQIQGLNGKLAALESKVASQGSYVTPAGTEGKGLFLTPTDIEVGGYLDLQYTNNITHGTGNIPGGNPGRIFDGNQDSFTVNAFELNFTKAAPEDGGWGFRVDVTHGEDSGVVIADGIGDRVDLQQAYVEYVAPLSFWEDSDVLPDSVTFIAGRFTTLAGLEVIEGPDNWNISRSFAFGLTIPFIHTGVRSNFQMFNDAIDLYIGVNNGWDVTVDNNKGKTIELGMGYEPFEDVSVFHAWYYGPENAATSGHKRSVLTNVVTWDATDKLSFMGEFNFGNERRVAAFANENIQWYSWNGYVRYQFTDKFAMSGRAELFADNSKFRSGLDDNLWEYTLTAEYALTDNVIARAELRNDFADNEGDILGGSNSQMTIGAQLLYLIG